MAYRPLEARTPAYLDEFLQMIEFLPNEASRTFNSLRELDIQMHNIESEGEDLMKAAAAKGRSRPNGAPEEAKKLHSDFNALQRRALELAAKKSALMERLYDSLDGVVRGLDKKLVEFEQHLRAENRWPSVTSNPGNNAPSAATNQHPLGGISRPGNGGEKAESGIVKSLEGNAAGLNTGSGTGLVRGGTAPNTVVIDIDDMIVDPNEPRYCTCNQVSYGEMVACENVDCKYEWFHFQCVGLTGPPRGQWRCPDCKRK